MHVRHTQELRNAHFLQTKAEPRLVGEWQFGVAGRTRADCVQYYRPWDLLPSEEDIIDDQVRDAEARVERERADFGPLGRNNEGREAQRTSKRLIAGMLGLVS